MFDESVISAIVDLGYTLESAEKLYEAYKRDRNGNWNTSGMTHDQIHADGVYGDLIDHFYERYAEEQEAYDREMDFVERDGSGMYERELLEMRR